MAKVKTVDYYSCRQFLTASTTVSEKFFLGATSATGEYNELGTDAILPDNKSGELSAVVIRNSSTFPGTNQTTETATAKVMVEVIGRCSVRARVAGVEIMKAPVWACAGPPEWLSAQIATATTTFIWAQNGGYMLMTLAHPVHPRASLQVELSSDVALSGTPTATTDALTCTLQVVSEREVPISSLAV